MRVGKIGLQTIYIMCAHTFERATHGAWKNVSTNYRYNTLSLYLIQCVLLVGCGWYSGVT